MTGVCLLRVFNADADPAAIEIRPLQPVTGASAVDFLERPTGALELTNGAVQVQLGSYRIATVRLST